MSERREEMLRERKKVMEEKSEWMDAERRRREGLREDKI